MKRVPPPYFETVRSQSRARWDQLERDPELAGPWRILFRQVQSPRHVLSELLQNADDARATRARACIADGKFIFEHNGNDFEESDFRSLCRFAYSNKRRMQTIGFRGIGFKSTFSLGSQVEIITPSIAVRFVEERFTEPFWIHDAPSSDLTQIIVAIKDSNREAELRQNLDEWKRSAAPLLFFNFIEELTLDDVTIRRRHLGPGPVPGSERVVIAGDDEHEVFVFTSAAEGLPEEAVAEIRAERGIEDIELPPCSVQLVVGLPGPQRLYVVLPTGVELPLPFSCNAPFLQDPARSAIKELSQSPTNRWLLGRLGRLAGEVFLNWLSDESLPPDQRARAYCLVPTKPARSPSLAAEATAAIANEFERRLQGRPTLLTSDEHLVEAGRCVAPPQSVYQIWTAAQLARLFGDDQQPVLHSAVPDDASRRLASWEWLEVIDEQGVINALSSGSRRVPRPENDVALLRLWELVQRNAGMDYGGRQRRRMQLVPVEGSTVLLRPADVIRLPQKKEGISDEAWQFLTRLLDVVEPRFLRLLEGRDDDADRTVQAARKLLEDVDLDRPTFADTIADRAYRTLVSRHNVTDEDLVTMAHLLAALDAKAPEGFLYIVQDGQRRPAEEGVIGTIDPLAESLLPGGWAAGHLLHSSYFEKNKSCRIEEWRKWSESEKSCLLPFVSLEKHKQFDRYDAYNGVQEILAQRGSEQRPWHYQKPQKVEIIDFGFSDELKEHWDHLSSTDDKIWAKVTEIVLISPDWYWSKSLQATMKEHNYYNSRTLGGPFDAEWIADLKARRSLFDTYGRPCAPAELYLRTPDTEPLQGAEPFVRADLDNEQTRPLLRALGVRERPASFDSILDRLRAIAQAPDPTPLLGEVLKWYTALDKLIARADARKVTEISEVFQKEALVLSADGTWLKSGEAYLSGSDEYPEPPLVHAAAKPLPMWTRVGVADRPSAELVLSWLQSLPSGARLDPATRRRVDSALGRYPGQVWQKCRHWLALDGSWIPMEGLKFRKTRSGRTNPDELFPRLRKATADLRMLDPDGVTIDLFGDLAELDGVVEFRLTNKPRPNDRTAEHAWFRAFGRQLMRVRLDDEAMTRHLREAAQRLARSSWMTCRPDDLPEVTPYVDREPVGPPQSRAVLWHEHDIFVRDTSVARLFDEIAKELAAPFGNARGVAEAVRACIERSADFIDDYVAQHFELAPETETPATVGNEPGDWTLGREEGPPGVPDFPEGAPPVQADRGAGVQVRILGGRGVSSRGEPASRLVEDAQERRRPLFELFETVALGLGYRWDEAQRRFVREDGWWISSAEPPFHWDEYNAAGSPARRYWVSREDLERSGVEIAAELWGHFKEWPDACVMILADQNGYPRTLPGPELDRLVKEGRVAVYPASFRLRKEPGS